NRPSTATATAASSHAAAPDYTRGATYAAGEQVQVWWGSTWWDGRVKEVQGDRYLVGYDGYSAGSDELLDHRRLKKKAQAQAQVVAPPSSPSAQRGNATAPAEPAAPSAAGPYQAGQAVEIEWHGSWWKGSIVAIKE